MFLGGSSLGWSCATPVASARRATWCGLVGSGVATSRLVLREPFFLVRGFGQGYHTGDLYRTYWMVYMALKKSQLYSSIWQSCDALRGGMDASQYKDYVLVMLL